MKHPLIQWTPVREAMLLAGVQAKVPLKTLEFQLGAGAAAIRRKAKAQGIWSQRKRVPASSRTEHLHANVTKAMAQELREGAAKNFVSLSKFIELTIRKGLENA